MAMTPRWIRNLFTGAALIAAGTIGLSLYGAPGWAQGDINLGRKDAPTSLSQDPRVARGRYIATAADCVACHTTAGGAPFAGGLDLKTPFGTLLSSNITSDRSAGIGSWTEHQFDAALRQGIGRNGHLYPAMPYTAYTKMSDADVADLWAYMRTVAPSANKVDENQLPFPFNIRPVLIFWNWLFFHEGRFQPDPKASAIVNRGAYLSEALEHCGTCHTPKNLLGADRALEAMQGATLQHWHAPDLTNNNATGLGSWNKSDFTSYLRSGSNRFTVASGPMGEAIVNSTQHLTDTDLDALAAYFKAMPARQVPHDPALPESDAIMSDGKRVYEANCIACHISSGAGVSGMIPSLAKNPAIVASDPASLLHVVIGGTEGTATERNPTGAAMPRFDWKLSDQQIADVLTYVRNSWGNAAPTVSRKDAKKLRAATGGRLAFRTNQ
jgi:mono/diheme cytochrome c family protein